jgi:branched-chain amino acid transport system ATP-binding protein
MITPPPLAGGGQGGGGPYLQVSNLDHRFGGLRALHDCSFAVEQGRITCLVGPNGAGKTTIFNVITGFLRPDAGNVTFKNRTLDTLRAQAIVHAGIARTFQNLRLFTDLSALDNVMIGIARQFGEEPIGAILRPLHTARAQRRRRDEASAILDHVGLADRAHDVVRNLSYGEQKLLTIARVLATGAELLLLDEPASGLSAGALDAVMTLLRRLQSEGKTLLVVEHNTRVVQQIADQVLFLHQGHLMAQGTPDQIITDPALAEIYFGGAL